jgi:Flp pilus assembly protein TadD
MKLIEKLSSILVLATASGMLWQAPAQADVFSHYQPNVLIKAERALQSGKPDRALTMLDGRIANLRHVGLQAQGHALVCKAHFQKRDFVSAEQACDKAVNTGEGSLSWSDVNNRGVMRLMLGRFDDALNDFHQAAVMNPGSRSIHRNISTAKREQQAQQHLAVVKS